MISKKELLERICELENEIMRIDEIVDKLNKKAKKVKRVKDEAKK